MGSFVCSWVLWVARDADCFSSFVLPSEHHFYKPLIENWYSCAEKRYNVSQIVITFLNLESWVFKNTPCQNYIETL
jgi:hypothetical protein